MRLLHLIKDEKFPDSAFKLFDAVAPGQSTYMLDGKSAPIVYLKRITPIRVSKYAFWNPMFIRSLERYDAILLHSLNRFSLEVLARLNNRVPVVWIGMGYDYYDLLTSGPSDLLKPETLKLHPPTTINFRKSPKHFIKSIINKRVLYRNGSRKRKLIQKVDLFAPVLQSEYELLKRSWGKELFPRYIRWNYGITAELVDGEFSGLSITGGNILVGNSADPTNNHIDILRYISALGVPSSSKIIVPLSYGNAIYRDKIIAEGERLFGEKFIPLTEFMELNKYIGILSTCSSVVMNHLRQQAAGNIFIALYLGAKVYLDKQNPLYAEFCNMGLEVKQIDAIREEFATLDQPLPPFLVNKQRAIIRKDRNREIFKKRTIKLIDELKRIKLSK